MSPRLGTWLSRVRAGAWRAALGPSAWSRLRSFCLFCGYGRSGSSAVSSVVDAHPGAVISHELNALKRHLDGVGRDALLSQIAWRAWRQQAGGRRSSRVDGGSYEHHLGGALRNPLRPPLVIGDKQAAGTARQLQIHGVGALDAFEDAVGVPLRVLHVVRNPYDVVAAGLVLGRSAFFELMPVVAEARARRLETEGAWLDVHFQDVLADPDGEIGRICAFLGLPLDEAHLARCRAYLFPEPHRRRFEVAWPPETKERVAECIVRYPFLSRYSWDA